MFGDVQYKCVNVITLYIEALFKHYKVIWHMNKRMSRHLVRWISPLRYYNIVCFGPFGILSTLVLSFCVSYKHYSSLFILCPFRTPSSLSFYKFCGLNRHLMYDITSYMNRANSLYLWAFFCRRNLRKKSRKKRVTLTSHAKIN